ncbi:MAG: hypothetical protein JW702_11025 [Clostridiales bacterium]|nr:hypothetical protein [Clostridiales bacterium]
MKKLEFNNQVTYPKVLAEFIKREYEKRRREGKIPVFFDQTLLCDTDFEDPIKNQKRLLFLEYRQPILWCVPLDTIWYKVTLNRVEFQSLHLIKEKYWHIMSNQTGRIADAVRNYLLWVQNLERIPEMNQQERIEMVKLITAIKYKQENTLNENLNHTLIFVGSTTDGPFTVIEGNKTTMDLYLKHFVENPTQQFPVIEAYVGISTAMDYYVWHYTHV